MDFYTSISKYYDQIFPYSPNQLLFVNNMIGDSRPLRILDIGCGTGSLSLKLAESGFEVYSIDYDSTMIERAKEKKGEHGQFPKFISMDMRRIADNFESGFFDAVLCFGNTLVHLLTMNEIEEFIISVSRVLKRNGHLLLQILNYDNILDNRIGNFPVIENGDIIFERYYDFPEGPLIDFRTRLTIKKNMEPVDNIIKLYPIRKDELVDILSKNDFRDIEAYGDFGMNELRGESLPLVMSAVNIKS